MPNVNKNVFQAITQAARSNQEISSAELASIKTEMQKQGGIDKDEQAVLNALEQGTQFEVRHGTEKATLSPQEVRFPTAASEPDIHEQNLDKTFLLRLADASPEEVRSWYTAHPEQRSQIREAFNAAFQSASPSEQVKLEKLGNQLQRLQDERNIGSAQDHYKNRSIADIAQEFVSKVTEAQSADAREAAIKAIAEDLRLLAFTSKGAGGRRLEERVYQALAQALEHKQAVYGQTHGSRSLPAFQLADAVAELQGPGSAEVKAQLAKIILEKDNLVVDSNPRDKANVHGGMLEKLLKSDPLGVTNALEYMADRNPGENRLLLNRALESVALRYADKPDAAADALGEILGGATRQYADGFLEKPRNQDKINKLGHNMGYLLRAAEKTVDQLAKNEKLKIDKGAFIVKVFSKGVSKLSGVKAIDKFAGKAIDYQAKKEKKEVEQWQKGIVSGYHKLMSEIFMSHEPGGGSATDAAQEFQDRQNDFETGFNKGYDNHKEEETKPTTRTYR